MRVKKGHGEKGGNREEKIDKKIGFEGREEVKRQTLLN
jgi:hypothetical protein